MHASKGGLTHAQIMAMTWRQFHVYLDAFTWLLREQTKEGKADNARADLKAMSQEKSLAKRKESLIEETKRITAEHIKRHEARKQGAPAVFRKVM